jgi:hypothetical protein
LRALLFFLFFLAKTQRNYGALGMTAGGLGGLAAWREFFFFSSRKACLQ